MSFLDVLGDIGGIVGGGIAMGPIGAAFGAYHALGDLTSSATGAPPPPAPPPPPDLTDEEVQQAALMQRQRLMLGRGVGSTFISGPLGALSPAQTSAARAGGI